MRPFDVRADGDHLDTLELAADDCALESSVDHLELRLGVEEA